MVNKRSPQLKEFIQDSLDSGSFSDTDFSNIADRAHDDDTLLHWAVRFFEKIEILAELVSLGIDINTHGDMLQTPLHVAVQVNNLLAAEWLIDNGASLTAVDELHGQPPLFGAMLQENSDGMISLLFQKVFGEVDTGLEIRIIESWAAFHREQEKRVLNVSRLGPDNAG